MEVARRGETPPSDRPVDVYERIAALIGEDGPGTCQLAGILQNDNLGLYDIPDGNLRAAYHGGARPDRPGKRHRGTQDTILPTECLYRLVKDLPLLETKGEYPAGSQSDAFHRGASAVSAVFVQELADLVHFILGQIASIQVRLDKVLGIPCGNAGRLGDDAGQE